MKTSWQATIRGKRLILASLFFWQFLGFLFCQSFTADQLDRYERVIACEDLRITSVHSTEHNDIFLDLLAAFLSATVEGTSAGVDSFPYIFRRLEETCSQEDDNWHAYLLAEAHLMSAVLDAIYQRQFSSVRNLRKASRLGSALSDDREYMPHGQKITASISLLVSQLSDRQQWWLQVFGGLKGDQDRAIQDLERLAQGKYHFSQEINYLLAFFDLQKDELDLDYAFSDSHQLSHLLEALKRMKDGDLDQALQEAEKCTLIKAIHLRGRILMYQGQWDEAIVAFGEYLKASDHNHWYELTQLYIHWCEICRNSQPFRSRAWVERAEDPLLFEDREAQKEFFHSRDIDRDILRARLRFDGRDPQAALDILQSLAPNAMLENQFIEYLYRKARCHQELGQQEEACKLYEKIVFDHSRSKLYYITASHLQLGIISAELSETDLAKKSLRECLKTSPTRYKTSLHRQAQQLLKSLD